MTEADGWPPKAFTGSLMPSEGLPGAFREILFPFKAFPKSPRGLPRRSPVLHGHPKNFAEIPLPSRKCHGQTRLGR